MSKFELHYTAIQDLVVIQRQPSRDSRGLFERMFCQRSMQPLLNGRVIKQVNRTSSVRRGTLRGMHFQYPPHAEVKLVSCIKGEVFDVAVDLRNGSDTFLEWHGELLSDKNGRTMVIPEGFAHGFQTLNENCEMLYFHTAEHCAEAEGALNALDPRLAIAWPEGISTRSERDTNHPLLSDDFIGIKLR